MCTIILILLKLEFVLKLHLHGFISSSGIFDSSMEILMFTDSLPCERNATVGNMCKYSASLITG